MGCVLIVHNEYRYRGGESVVADTEAALLASHGWTVERYTRGYDELPTAAPLKMLLPFTALFSWKSYLAVRQIIRARGVDIVHVHNTVPLISPSVYYAAWAEGVPVVQTVHNFRFLCPNGLLFRDGHICEECLDRGLYSGVRHGCYRGSRAQTLALAGVLRLHRLLGTYRRVEAYICLTDFNRSLLARKLPIERIHVKPNLMPPAAGAPVPESARSGYCYVGRLSEEKGVLTAIEAFCELPGETLTVAGDGPLTDRVRALVKERGASNIHLLGRVDGEEARALIARSRALILPSVCYEGMPVTVLESLAAGVPVIGSDMGNAGALIRASGAGTTFRPGEHADLCRVVSGLTDAALSDMSRRARQTAESWPDADGNYALLSGVYEAARAVAAKRKRRDKRNEQA